MPDTPDDWNPYDELTNYEIARAGNPMPDTRAMTDFSITNCDEHRHYAWDEGTPCPWCLEREVAALREKNNRQANMLLATGCTLAELEALSANSDTDETHPDQA